MGTFQGSKGQTTQTTTQKTGQPLTGKTEIKRPTTGSTIGGGSVLGGKDKSRTEGQH